MTSVFMISVIHSAESYSSKCPSDAESYSAKCQSTRCHSDAESYSTRCHFASEYLPCKMPFC